MIDIPSDKYSYKLLGYLYGFLFSEDAEVKKSASLLMRILKMKIPHSNRNGRGEDITKVRLGEEEQNTILSNGWFESDNIEVKCRCNDLMLKNVEGDRRKKTLDVCLDYLLAYKTIEYGMQYLLRSMQIARYFHISDVDYINNVCMSIRQVPTAWFKDFAKEAKNWLSEDKKQEFISFLLTAKEKIDYPKNHADNERHCLEALYVLGYYDKDKCIYETALSYERTADYFDNLHKEDPHTYQYGAFIYMDKAYKAIVKVKNQYKQDYLRLQKKLGEQQSIENEAISIFGARVQFKISEQTISFVSHKLIGKDSMNVITWLWDFPFPDDNKIKEKEKNAAKEYEFLYRSFSKSLYNNEEGNIIGTADGAEWEGEIYYKNFRFNVRFVVNYALTYICIMEEPGFRSKFGKFIEEKKVHLLKTTNCIFGSVAC